MKKEFYDDDYPYWNGEIDNTKNEKSKEINYKLAFLALVGIVVMVIIALVINEPVTK